MNLEKILSIPEETQTIEFKRLGETKVVAKVIKTIVAMTNTDGGHIFLGVDDPEKTDKRGLARVYGIEENLDVYDAIGREMQRIIPPVGNIWPPELLLTDNGTQVAIIRVPKSENEFCSIDNSVYVKQHKSIKTLSPSEVVELSYAKGFIKADKELVDVDFSLLDTQFYADWKQERNLPNSPLPELLTQLGLARKNTNGVLQPTRAAVLLFASYPTNIMDTKCAVRIYKYQGTIERFDAAPNLVGEPKTIEGPIVKLINETQRYVLEILESGIEVRDGFYAKYKLPERAVKEAITNAVIHRDYHLKRDIEIRIFEDRIDIMSPGLFSGNITAINIGRVRANNYRNDLLVKHLREFPNPPNLDRNEGVQAMRNEMSRNNLYPPIFVSYPYLQDAVRVILLNELQSTEWDKIKNYLEDNTYVDNSTARDVTGVEQLHSMSRLFKKWVDSGLLLKVGSSNKTTRYKLVNREE